MQVLSSFISRWTRLRRFKSIEAIRDDSGEWTFRLIQVGEKKNEVDFTRQLEVTNLEPAEKISAAILTISGRGVLIKDESKITNPKNDNSEEFYQSKEGNWSAIVRREEIDELIDFLRQKKFEVVGLFLGPISSIPFLSNSTSLSEYQLSFQDNSLTRISRLNGVDENHEIEILGFKIESKFGLGILNSLSFMSQQNSACDPLKFDQIKNHFQDRIFLKGTLISALAITFIALMANFLVFNSLNKELGELTSEKLSLAEQTREFRKSKQEEKELTEILQKANFNKKTKTTPIIDHIGQVVPPEIKLTSIEVYPMSGDQSRKELSFERDLVNISGETKGSESLTVLLKSVDTLPLLSEASLKSMKEDRSGKFQFLIEGRIR